MSKIRIFFHSNSHKIFLSAFIIAFLFQINFWLKTENIKPQYNILPHLPSPYAIKALSLGDNEFLFRVLSLRLQNSGDVFAGFVSLKYYDYSLLNQWFKALDGLNAKSNLIPSLASYYFSQTQNKMDSRYIVDYLDWRSSKDLDTNWWWVFQASIIATNVLQDKKLALKLAYKLSENNAKNAPLWTKQMPATLLAKEGEDCLSFRIIENLIEENEAETRKITVEEMNFMRYFIKDRLKKLHDKKFDPKKC